MSVQVSAQIDMETKQQFDEICNNIGISPSGAISIFIRGVINNNGIPFSVIVPQNEPDQMSRKDVFGCMRGKFKMADDFNEPLEDFEEYDILTLW